MMVGRRDRRSDGEPQDLFELLQNTEDRWERAREREELRQFNEWADRLKKEEGNG